MKNFKNKIKIRSKVKLNFIMYMIEVKRLIANSTVGDTSKYTTLFVVLLREIFPESAAYLLHFIRKNAFT